jgi:hypothetical protein
MTDHFQQEPPRPRLEGADLPTSDDPNVDHLLRRVQVLEKEKRRWKAIGVTAIVVLLLLFVGGGVMFVGSAGFFAYRMKAAQMQAEMEADRARMEAIRAQEALEQARQEAARRKAQEEAK